MVWLIMAGGSALFAGITSVLAKAGLRGVDSNLATAIRTTVVLLFSWSIVFLTGEQQGLTAAGADVWCFLILSGLATGASWLCYFRAVQLGDVSRVAPIDKSSAVLTVLLALLLFREPVSAWTLAGIAAMAAGTWMMVGKQAAHRSRGADREKKSNTWMFYACLSAVFASATALLGKLGVQGIGSNLATAVRTCVVLLLAWGIVLATGKQHGIRTLNRSNWLFLLLSGLATGLSWLCYYYALQNGPASVVVPIDKLSVLVTVAFSVCFLHEPLGKREAAGLALLTGGTLLMLL